MGEKGVLRKPKPHIELRQGLNLKWVYKEWPPSLTLQAGFLRLVMSNAKS